MNNMVKFKGRGLFEVDLDSIISDKNDPIAPLIDENKEVYYEEFITESEALKWRNSNKRIVEKYQHINEETYKNLVQMSDAKRKARAKKLKTRYLGVTPGRGWIKFSTESQRIRGKYYTQYIKLAEAKDMKYFKEFNSREIVRLFMSGDVQVYCSCLRADTKIKLLDGSCPTVRDMMNRFNSGENMWVYSVDSDGNFKPGKVNKVFISGKASKLLRITLDNGKSVETTCDHLFMKRDGSYCKAEKLKVGDSLMSLYFKETDNRCHSVSNHKVENIEVIYCDDEEVFDISVEKYHNFYVDAGVIVHNCPDFHYRMKYAAYHLGYGIFREDRYPKIRNPNFDYVLCKHLICVLKVLGLNWTMISRDMKNTKFYKRKAEDEEYMRELEKKKAFKKKMKKGK